MKRMIITLITVVLFAALFSSCGGTSSKRTSHSSPERYSAGEDALSTPGSVPAYTDGARSAAETHANGAPEDFSPVGKWKNVGEYTFGQAQKNAIIYFDDVHCGFYSPKDTYAFYKSGDDYRLDCTSYLFAETLSFTVKVADNDHMKIYNGANQIELVRVG